MHLDTGLKIAIWIATGVPVALLMEPWAALLHGRVWHGVLWRVHRSHHRPRPGRFEANDWLSGTHAPLSIALILAGCLGPEGVAREIAFGAGLGMAVFGLSYVIVHDGLVHGRLPVAFLGRVPYLARVRDAHLEHHRGTPGEPYGLFAAPLLRRESPRASPSAQRPASRSPSRPSTSP